MNGLRTEADIRSPSHVQRKKKDTDQGLFSFYLWPKREARTL